MMNATRNNTILCVDDEVGILDFYRLSLAPPHDEQLLSVAARRDRRKRGAASEPDHGAPAYRVLLAQSGQEAIDLVRAELEVGRRVAAGFFDMRMPGGLDGLETIRRIKLMDPEVMCAVVTAYTDWDMQQLNAAFRHRDEWMYFNKPFGEGELVQAANHLVSRWNRMRDEEATRAALEERNRALDEARDRTFSSCMNTIRVMSTILESKDPYLLGHSQRVASYATALGRAMGIPDLELARLYDGFLLHDVGKLGVPDTILQKPGVLTAEERQVIETHPVVGVQLLENLIQDRELVELVRHHHESYDGRGYPDKLAGDAIPLGARVLAVADTWDALTSNRPYRNAMPRERAIQIMVSCRGTQHDPKVTDTFLALLGAGLEATLPPHFMSQVAA